MTSRYATKLELIKGRLNEAIRVIEDAFDELDDITLKNSKLIMPYEKTFLDALQASIGCAVDATRGAYDFASELSYCGKEIENDIHSRAEVA